MTKSPRPEPFLWAAALVVLSGIVIHSGVRAYERLQGDGETAVCCREVWQETAALDGMFFREEETLRDGHEKFRPTAAEGRRVGGGDAVGIVYDTDPALRRRETALRLAEEAEALEAALSAADPAARQQGLHRSLRSLSTALSRGENGKALSSAHILEYYLLGHIPDGAGGRELRAVAAAVPEEEAPIYPAPRSGIFSARTDGWETYPTAGLVGLTAGELTRLLAMDPPDATAPGFGRIVTDSRWYYAALASGADAERLSGPVTLLLPEGERLEGEVVSVSPAEAGRCAVVITGNTGLDRVLYRRQAALRVLLTETEGLAVPASALREDEAGTYVLRAAGAFSGRADAEVLAERDGRVLLHSPGLRENTKVLLETR